MANKDTAKEKVELKPDEQLRADRIAAGWTTTEWGEFIPPVLEINTKEQIANVGRNVVTENKVVIPKVAKPVEEK